MCAVHSPSHAQVPPLKLEGSRFVDEQGEPVTLTGVNIGNWLVLEPWMLAVPTDGERGFRDQHDILTLLNRRFGEIDTEAFLDVYRSYWFTERDAENIRGFGMNVIRVPFHYSLLTTESGPLELRDDAFQWLDRAVELASHAGLYVIFDLHGAPGGQSIDMPSGRVNYNNLWSSSEYQHRTVWLWRQIAARYKDSDVVIAYDLLNEPYGDFQTDLSSELISLMDDIIREVRAVDPDTLVFVPGQISGIDFYGDPKARGWTNTGFTEHFYPGIFGGEERSLRRHARFVACELAVRKHQLAEFDVPFLVGEFNTIFESIGGASLLVEQIDRFEAQGWLTTMWTYRIHRNDGVLPQDNWSLVTNAEAFAFDFHGMSFDELVETALRLGNTSLEKDLAFIERFRSRSARGGGLVSSMPEVPIGGTTAGVPGWTIRSIGGASIGDSGLTAGRLHLAGGGDDAFGRTDSCVFAVPKNHETPSRSIAADLTAFDAHQQYAKAGLMIRSSEEAGSPHVAVHAFPSGEIRMLWRATSEGLSFEQTLAVAALPVRMGIIDHGDVLEAWVADQNGELGRSSFPREILEPRTGTPGAFILSHEDPAIAQATLSRVIIGDQAREIAAPESQSPVTRGEFVPHDSGWSTWGSGVRQTEHSLQFAGSTGVLEAGAWRDLDMGSPGWRTIAFEARLDDEMNNAEFEIRTEIPGDVPLTLTSETFRTQALPVGGRWVRLELESPVNTTTTRLLFRIVRGDGAFGQVEFRNIEVLPARIDSESHVEIEE